MIKMVLIKGEFCPMVTCDICGDVIDAQAPGNVNWERSKPHTLYAVHKGPRRSCQRRFDVAHPAAPMDWESAEAFLEQLAYNYTDPIVTAA